MPHAIRFHKTGGPEVLQWEEVAVGDPGPGEARVAHKAIGLNFIETYHRSGLYPLPLPSGLGTEASGVVEAVGPERDRGEAGRPRGLLQRPARRLLGGARHARGQAREASRRHLLRAGREHDAPGPHGPVPAAPHAPRAEGRRHHPLAGGGGRSGPHRLPVGQGAGHQPYRHRELGGEGEARARARSGAHRALHEGGFREARRGDHRTGRSAPWCTTPWGRTPS